MKLAIGCDHAGYNLKEHLKPWLQQHGHEVRDFGVHNTDSMDYPDIGYAVAAAVATGNFDRGLLVCGSGIGVCMVANRVKGVRAVNCRDTTCARLSRQHNDANLITLGERLTTPTVAEDILQIWLATAFEGDRHQRRIDKIDAYQGGC